MCVCLKQTAARRTAPDYYIIIRCSTTLLIKQHTNQCHSLNDTIRVRPRTTLARPRELFTCELAAGGSIYASRYVHLSTTVRTQRSSLGGATHQMPTGAQRRPTNALRTHRRPIRHRKESAIIVSPTYDVIVRHRTSSRVVVSPR